MIKNTKEKIMIFETITEREDGVKLVSARELHENLGLSKRFSAWIEQYIKEDNDYFFINGDDFTSVLTSTVVNNGAKIELQDYAITLSMAKEICMVTKNEAGKKCRRYFINLERENKQLKEDNKELAQIAESDEDRAIRIRKANIVQYSINNIKTRISECNYTNIAECVNKIIEVHKDMYVKERYKTYQDTSKYGNRGDNLYVNHVRAIVEKSLDELRPSMSLKDNYINPIMGDLARKIARDIEVSENISDGKEKAKLTKEINRLKNSYEPDDMWEIDYHPFSYDNHAIINGKWSPAYAKWIKNFPKDQLPSAKEIIDSGVDFGKPVRAIIKCVNKSKFDTSNLNKALNDVLFNTNRGAYPIDDNFIKSALITTVATCDDIKEGKMWFKLVNLTDKELKNIDYEYDKHANCIALINEL